MTDRRSIRVEFVYRKKVDNQLQQEFIPCVLSLSEGETFIWDGMGIFAATHIRFDVPDWSFDLQEAEQRGVEKFKQELRMLGIEALREKLQDILYSPEDTYEYED